MEHNNEQADSNKPTLKREDDSLDDFEHLGHDASPLKDSGVDPSSLSPSSTFFPTAHSHQRIDDDNEIHNVGNDSPVPTTTGASTFDDFIPPTVSQMIDLGESVLDSSSFSGSSNTQKNTLESSLLEMGDNFPDRKEADEKLEKFLDNMREFSSSEPASKPKVENEEENNKEKVVAQSEKIEENLSEENILGEKPTEKIQDDEINIISHFDEVPKPLEPISLNKSNDEPSNIIVANAGDHQLERFSDSDPEDEEIKRHHSPSPTPSEKEIEFEEKLETIVKDLSPELANEKLIEMHHVDKIDSQIIVSQPENEPEYVEKSEEPPKVDDPKSRLNRRTFCPYPRAIEVEEIFCQMGLDTWFNPDKLNPKVESLIYWRDPKKSGPLFGGVLLVLLALTYFSLISVIAYASLLTLTGTISYRIYKNVLQAVQKTGDGHPFKECLECNLQLPQVIVQQITEVGVVHLNATLVVLRKLFLVEDLVDSIKFGVLLWTLTYLGAWFNGMTLIIIAWVALFTLPKVYETNKTQIDANLALARTKLDEITSKIKAAIPIGKKSEEKKE